ncbi:MAG TPA: 50S ribosomal protein L25/general stress protein Ctc [Gammaproteobacteria bacterium]|nr:50S ribosomal protein L25/general stress protein Ctc [Gammaproteobacteria bacterium]
MSINFVLEAEPRTDLGKGASRRLRRTGMVPAVIYGSGKDPVSLSISHNTLQHSLENEAFYSHILTIKLGGKEEQAILKDLQRHPSKPVIMHMDLQRVSANEKLRIHAPLHFLNEENAPGVKEGGLVSHSQTEIEISCLPKDLPEFIEVDLGALELDASIHLSEIALPAGVEAVELTHGEGHDPSIVSIHMARGAKESDEIEGEAEEGEATAEGGEE